TTRVLTSVSPLTCRILFLSKRSGHLRHLHSFPTRRSSDLSQVRLAETYAANSRPATTRASGAVAALVSSGCSRPRSPAKPQHPQDRKSTRLNSSHVSISYAVFCLKKKSETDQFCPPAQA